MAIQRRPYRQILLVGENQEKGVPELVLVQHALQLLASLDDTVPIVAVNHEDDTLGVLEVVAPQRTDLVLTTDIPHGELNVLVLDGLDVETCGRVSVTAIVDSCEPALREVDGRRGVAGTDRSWGWW